VPPSAGLATDCGEWGERGDCGAPRLPNKIRTGLAQIVGHVRASDRDSQSNRGAKSHNSARPCVELTCRGVACGRPDARADAAPPTAASSAAPTVAGWPRAATQVQQVTARSPWRQAVALLEHLLTRRSSTSVQRTYCAAHLGLGGAEIPEADCAMAEPCAPGMPRAQTSYQPPRLSESATRPRPTTRRTALQHMLRCRRPRAAAAAAGLCLAQAEGQDDLAPHHCDNHYESVMCAHHEVPGAAASRKAPT
jgi:hypothetical protein